MSTVLSHFVGFERIHHRDNYWKGIEDGCRGCSICGISYGGLMQASEVIKFLTNGAIDIYNDFIHSAWEGEGSYSLWNGEFDLEKLKNPREILKKFNREELKKIREKYYSLPESERPKINIHWSDDEEMSQEEIFENRMRIAERAIELWEKGEYIGWEL